MPAMIDRYEAQDEAEARFVRGVDKLLPKLVHMIDGCHGLREEGIGVAELAGVIERQRASLMTYAGEFGELMDLHVELGERAVALHAAGQAGHG
jgi:putative hydrolase of HD superfamily